jgi:hypothetical protein
LDTTMKEVNVDQIMILRETYTHCLLYKEKAVEMRKHVFGRCKRDHFRQMKYHT